MELELPENADKNTVFDTVETHINDIGLKISDVDDSRPWGGFFVIAKEATDKFIDIFFPDVDKEDIYRYGKELGPKILVVEPNQKLSWQYHHRRAELWKAINGPVGVLESENDNQPDEVVTLNPGNIIQHDNQTRHRLVGLDNWGVIAEIWQHTDPQNPSDEEDIVRLEDSYGRG
jgi:mannose-6-phosphate isomerase-like protein (cupin superfamily)